MSNTIEENCTWHEAVDLYFDALFEKLDQGNIETDRFGIFFPTAVLERIELKEPLRKTLSGHELPEFLR